MDFFFFRSKQQLKICVNELTASPLRLSDWYLCVFNTKWYNIKNIKAFFFFFIGKIMARSWGSKYESSGQTEVELMRAIIARSCLSYLSVGIIFLSVLGMMSCFGFSPVLRSHYSWVISLTSATLYTTLSRFLFKQQRPNHTPPDHTPLQCPSSHPLFAIPWATGVGLVFFTVKSRKTWA